MFTGGGQAAPLPQQPTSAELLDSLGSRSPAGDCVRNDEGRKPNDNYVPAYQRLKTLYLELGQAEQTAELERFWSVDEEGEQDQPSTTEAEIA